MILPIEPKKKKCKGTGPAKGYGCGEMTYHRHYGLCKSKCYPDWLLNSELGKIKMKKAYLRAAKPRKELERAYSLKKNDRSLGWLKINVRTIFHDYVKERDKGKPCISCDAPWHSDFQAGHFYKAELFSSLKYNEFNVHGQCPGCNLFKDGNHQEYSVRLEKRIGKKAYLELQELARMDKQTNFKWDKTELKGVREYYKDKIKALK